jgi:hypothetical protein
MPGAHVTKRAHQDQRDWLPGHQMRINKRYFHDREWFSTFFDIKLFVIMAESLAEVQAGTAGLAW